MTLKTDIDQLVADAAILHDIVHGTSGQTVSTEGGAVKTVAKAVADAEALIVTGAESYLDQCQAETALATAQATTATNQAAAAAASALSAASVVSQDLSAIDRTVFSATIVDAFIYDTEKDSDGGAWRKRCSHTSWENETLSGNWLGSAANETAARLLSGATTGSLYYDTTAAKFYTLNASSGKTEVFRGNTAKFPAKVLITVEAARVVIWDLTVANAPMWMVFVGNGSATNMVADWTGSMTCVSALNGKIVQGHAVYDIALIDFIADGANRMSTATYRYKGNISQRNGALGTIQINSTGLVNRAVNDVAMTVLPNAPVDVATGLPVPTIAVATNGGVSVIKDDGTVVNWGTTFGTILTTAINKYGHLLASGGGGVAWRNWFKSSIPTSTPDNTSTYTFDESSTPTRLGPNGSSGVSRSIMAGNAKVFDVGNGTTDLGLNILRDNPATPASGMVAYVTKDYNSGWQVGAIKGAWLADTVAETVTGTELITNGDFAAGTTGWTAINGTGLAVASGELTVTNVGASNGEAEQAVTTVAGKTYTVSATARVGTATPVYIRAGATSGTFGLGSALTTSATNVPISFTFVATGTTTYIAARNISGNGLTGIFDNISCRLADVDRSVKANGLQAFGSITKAAVASGAALMGYSGFSAANYLKQPYSSDLDFGTGDFCIMGWARSSGNGTQVLIGRTQDATASAADWAILLVVGVPYFGYGNGAGFSTLLAATSAINTSIWRFVAFTRISGVMYSYIDGKYETQAASTNNFTDALAGLWLGNSGVGYYAGASYLALWRVSATAPSAEQIKHIYETEKALFEANAQCCLAGSSNAVLALAYDDEADQLHVGTSYGRSAFKGLVRVASEATPVGAITALSASGGFVAQGGASGADIYVPAYLLREELRRRAEQMAKFGQNLIAHDFTATASQTTFTLPVGWEIVAVYQQGSIKRETTSWSRSFDGFKWSVVLGTGATVSDWISILAKRV